MKPRLTRRSFCLPLAMLVALPLAAGRLSAQQGVQLKNGSVDYVDVTYDASLIPRGGITLEAWVTYDEKLGSGWRWPTICRQNPAAGQESFLLRVDAARTANRNLRWYVLGQNGALNVLWRFPTGTFSKWKHVAGTYDGAVANLYVDGKLVASRRGAVGRIVDRGNALKIGSGDGTAIETWNGGIDEVRLWPFARTGAEIAQTMKYELRRVPGRVSTWNLNRTARDSSGKNHGKWVGKAGYATNALKLTVLQIPGAVARGTATKGCRGDSICTVTSVSDVGNAAFAVASTRGAPNSPSVALVAATTSASATRVLGLDIWLNIATFVGPVALATNRLGTVRLPIPIPNDTKLSGVGLAVQFLHVDAGCKSSTLSSSPALRVGIR